MPLRFQLLQQGDKYYGYIRITTFETDSVYLTHAWETALNTFKRFGVPVGLIVDVRENGGGSGTLATYFAGSFYTQPFELFEMFQADKAGHFISQGKQMVLPAPVQWTNPVAVLVGPDCASACEIFSGAVAHDPNHLIVGYYPSAGIEASVEAWTLPENVYFQAPTGRLVDPVTQQPYLESVGVPPNVKVPVSAANLLSKDDPQLIAAEQAIDQQMVTSGG
jgi:C-terminal processing protease CtpA/Prc